MLLISNPELFTTYRNDTLYAHIIAFRPNTERDPDIIITDYTSNIRLREKTTNEENRLGLAADQRMVCKINSKVLERIQEEYEAIAKHPFFKGQDAHMTNSNWIEISMNFCFVKLNVRFRKGLEGVVTGGSVVNSYQEDFQYFWARFLKEVIPDLEKIPSYLLNLVKGCLNDESFEILQKAFVTQDLPSAPSALEDEKPPSHVKQEEEYYSQELEVEDGDGDQMSNRNSLFQKTLEPVSQDNFSQSFLGSSSSMKSTEANIPDIRDYALETEEFLTQIGTLPQSVNPDATRADGQDHSYEVGSLEVSSEKAMTIKAITRLSREVDGRIHKIRAQFMGYFPLELAHLCTKLYVSKNGEVKTTGPQYGSLKLVFADSGSTTLTNENSIIVQIPKASVLKFFACKHVEQLYILLKSKQNELDKLLKKSVSIEVSLTRISHLNEWVSKNVTLEDLLI